MSQNTVAVPQTGWVGLRIWPWVVKLVECIFNPHLTKNSTQQYYFRMLSLFHLISVKVKFPPPCRPSLYSPWLWDWMGLRKLLVWTPDSVLGFLLTGLYIIFIPRGFQLVPAKQLMARWTWPAWTGLGFRHKVMGCHHINTLDYFLFGPFKWGNCWSNSRETLTNCTGFDICSFSFPLKLKDVNYSEDCVCVCMIGSMRRRTRVCLLCRGAGVSVYSRKADEGRTVNSVYL